MKNSGIEPDVISYSAAISACEKGGRWEQALEVFDEMRSRGVEPNVITYTSAMSACVKSGEPHTALRLFDELLETEGSSSETSGVVAPDGPCYHAGRQW